MFIDFIKLKIFVSLILLGSLQCIYSQALYTQTGTDPTWEELLENNTFPLGVSSSDGVLGSIIDVNNELVELGNNANRPIDQSIKLHAPPNSGINRSDFPKWTRWYQEDGNTQVFRLFENEENVHNSRALAARTETFGNTHWTEGEWHEWVGTYTIVKPHGCAIFQAKNNINDWSVMINLSSEGNITLNHRRHQDDIIIARNMTGKSFELGVRDNGRDYEVYYNGEKVGAGYYDRPEGTTTFRWGMYVGSNPVVSEAMIFVTGATIDPYPGIFVAPDSLKLITNIDGQGTILIGNEKDKYVLNENVSLFATPRSGGTFMGWSGDITSTDNPLYFSMDTHKTIKATFEYFEEKAPYKETAISIPGIIQAEYYDFGGDGISYNDSETGNFGYTVKGVDFRVNDAVDIDTHPSDGYVVGWTATGEWLEYTVDVQYSGLYNLKFYYSSELNAKLGVEVDGEPLLSNVSLRTTGSLSSYFSVSKEVELNAGEQIWRLIVEEGGFNLDRINVTHENAVNITTNEVHVPYFFSNSLDNRSLFLSEPLAWEVYSMLGVKLKSGKGDSIELQNLISGLYLLVFANKPQKIFLN